VDAPLAFPIRAEDEETGVCDRSAEEAEQEQRRRVGSMKVVDADEKRTGTRGLDQVPRHGVEELETHALWIGAGRGEAVRRRFRKTFELAACPAHNLDPRPVRRCPTLLPAASHHDMPAVIGSHSCELLHQPGLANARLARDEDEGAVAGIRLLERGTELMQLLHSTDERASRARRRHSDRRRLARAIVPVQLQQPARTTGQDDRALTLEELDRRPGLGLGFGVLSRAAQDLSEPELEFSDLHKAVRVSDQRERAAREHLCLLWLTAPGENCSPHRRGERERIVVVTGGGLLGRQRQRFGLVVTPKLVDGLGDLAHDARRALLVPGGGEQL
jgi:hypothetical protein